MIRVDAVTRTYANLAAVDRVCFEIGAGKTTLMKMRTGYLEPTGGSLEIDGLDIGSNREAGRATRDRSKKNKR